MGVVASQGGSGCRTWGLLYDWCVNALIQERCSMSLFPASPGNSDTEVEEADAATVVGLQDESDVFSVLT